MRPNRLYSKRTENLKTGTWAIERRSTAFDLRERTTNLTPFRSGNE